MLNFIKKLDNPERVSELNPTATLEKVNLSSNMVFCDIGAGTGLFSFEAAKNRSVSVYALEKSSEMLAYMSSKISEQKFQNIELIKVSNETVPLPDQSCDIVMLCTVFHELPFQADFLIELKRILKPNGKLAIIDFHKKVTPLGPPIEHRISNSEIIKMASEAGFSNTENSVLGENFYMLTFMSFAK